MSSGGGTDKNSNNNKNANTNTNNNTNTPTMQRVTTYRVFVTEGMVPGQLIRAGYNGHEWLVRVPNGAVLGDSIIFRMTEENVAQAIAAANTSTPYTNETAFLESSLVNNTLVDPNNNSSGGSGLTHPQNPPSSGAATGPSRMMMSFLDELFVDPQRIVFLGSIYVLAFVFGLVSGSLHYTRNGY